MVIIFRKIFLTVSLLSIIVYTSNAQGRITDANGRPIMSTKNLEIEGSPFLFDDWKQGSVKLNNGTEYDSTELKLDVLENHLLFKGSNNEPLMFSEPVKEFKLFFNNNRTQYKLYRNGYDNTMNFYEVLVDGKSQLLKHYKKSLGAKASYASSTTVRMILDAVNYYLYKSNALIAVKKDKKSILNALVDKQTELESYIKINNIKFKDDNDLIKLIIYYNSI
ncbi:MAG: hypothetical protein EOP45_03215 [Sphingobacteriaceae bacterium]|nr:MAG: hypothetical protein EOP45_03215 [Sphingobacteriaceae bacterium]